MCMLLCVQSRERDVRPVTKVETSSLAEFIQLVNSSRSPTTFDLDGRELCHVGADSVTISANNVSICNGTIQLANAGDSLLVSLRVTGAGVEMDDIIVHGGATGVSVQPGGSVTMRSCTLQGMICGVELISAAQGTLQPSFVAHNLKILDCSMHGLFITAKTHVQLTDCVITGMKGAPAAVVLGCLHATRTTCAQSIGIGMYVGITGQAVLTDSTITGNKGGSVDAAFGSSVKLVRCTTDAMTAATISSRVTNSTLQQVGRTCFKLLFKMRRRVL